MSSYHYRALDARGRIRKGKTRAANSADLETRLRKTGLELISCKSARPPLLSLPRRRVQRRDLIVFCFHLQQSLRAGVPAPESLQDLRDSAGNPRLRQVAGALLEAIEGGKTLSAALREFPAVFSEVFVNLIQAGEQTGALDAILERLGSNLKWQDEQAAMTRKLLLAPALTGAVVGIVVVFLMAYLVPQLLAFVGTTGSELPSHTLLLIAVSTAVTDYWQVILCVPLLCLVIVVAGARTSPGFRLALDRFRLALPVVGPAQEKLILARLAGLFAMMYASGITVIDCISAGERSAGNLAVAQAMSRVGAALAEGQNLGDSFAAGNLFPPLMLRMIRVGETTGALAPALENIAWFYTRDARAAVGRLQSLIEPVMTLALGLVIGWVMLSVFGPIYDLITGLGV
ncbi:MAG: type II secretion system F family protein [Gammaproteobacteria bacterium]|nr:type II secretion system F family protein [Gammaproteobacteria bacterium]MCY4211902.1 type II secretion system F family protein [Gammaproteobacteria bacterium]MCY4283273.1 type II secretion system F family protein [Gammaproteobacteria bacterium]MCY4339068.1 type II secretion system F family protein [Gammaproteobacteria bacterium]